MVVNNTLHQLPGTYMQTCMEANDGFIFCAAEYIHVVTNGLFWPAMLLGFCAILFIATIKVGVKKSFGFASFVMINGSIMLALLELMTWWIASAFIITGMIGVAMMVIRE